MVKRVKLTVDDVIQIKRLLLDGERQGIIARQFGVTNSVVSNIKTGKLWKDVIVDEYGNYLPPPDPKPEDYQGYMVEEEEVKPKVVNDESVKYRKQFINDYFVKRVIKTNGVFVKFEPATEKSKSFILGRWKKFSWMFRGEYDDFISQIMLIVTEKVMLFKPEKKGFNWENVSVVGRMENNVMHDVINKGIKTELNIYAQKINNNYLKKEVAGRQKAEYSWVDVDIYSTDKVVESDEGDYSLIELLGEDANLYAVNSGYVKNHFIEWLNKHGGEILTPEQLRDMQIMVFYQRDRDDDYITPYSQLPDEYKPYKDDTMQTKKWNIRKKVNPAYEKVEKLSFREMERNKELEFWQAFIDLVRDEGHLHNQNAILREWILTNIDHNYLDKLLDGLGKSDKKQIAAKTIDNRLLYKLAGLINDRFCEVKELVNYGT